ALRSFGMCVAPGMLTLDPPIWCAASGITASRTLAARKLVGEVPLLDTQVFTFALADHGGTILTRDIAQATVQDKDRGYICHRANFIQLIGKNGAILSNMFFHFSGILRSEDCALDFSEFGEFTFRLNTAAFGFGGREHPV